MIAISLKKDQLKNFVVSLAMIISDIRMYSSNHLLPIAIQNSPIDPDTEMIIIMRTFSQIKDIYFLN